MTVSKFGGPKITISILWMIVCVFFGSCLVCAGQNPDLSRHPAVAGSFYPKDKAALEKKIDNLFSRVTNDKNLPSKDDLPQKLKALILPHAGYTYSGYTTAIGYQLLKERSNKLPVDTIILIGPYHQANFPGISIWTQGSWETPLGYCQIDEQLAQAIHVETPAFHYNQDIHLKEHSLEVHVPFIQRILPKAKIVPILISDPDYAKLLAQAIAKYLAKHMNKDNIVVIASTDMSHYHPAEEAKVIDHHSLTLFEKLFSAEKTEMANLYDSIKEKNVQMCGVAAVLTVFELSNLMNWDAFKFLDYRTSGDETGDNTSVVGYGSSVIFKDERNADQSSQEMSPEQRQILIGLARKTIETYLSKGTLPPFETQDPNLQVKRAVFVTIRGKDGSLRGCIGRFTPEESLYKAVMNMAIEAATKDSRFSPVLFKEIQDLTFEISILSPIRTVSNPDDIVFGTHGVILSQGVNSGVFLPEVAESFPNKEEFLSELCSQKTGLERTCWKDSKTKIEVFTTSHFVERSLEKTSQNNYKTLQVR